MASTSQTLCASVLSIQHSSIVVMIGFFIGAGESLRQDCGVSCIYSLFLSLSLSAVHQLSTLMDRRVDPGVSAGAYAKSSLGCDAEVSRNGFDYCYYSSLHSDRQGEDKQTNKRAQRACRVVMRITPPHPRFFLLHISDHSSPSLFLVFFLPCGGATHVCYLRSVCLLVHLLPTPSPLEQTQSSDGAMLRRRGGEKEET
jgi:hypothetical protein